MDIKVTSPKDMHSLEEKLKDAVGKFEAEFKNVNKNEGYYHLVIEGEYEDDVYEEVMRLYSEAGWGRVVCSSSSKKGERGGLSGLILYR